MKYLTYIAEDEPLARQRIKFLLQNYPTFQLVGEASEGEQALQFLQNNQVDVLFLDVHMPGYSGLEVLQNIPPNHRPFTVFVTAFDQYAIQAFDYFAIDYLLKPYSNQRFYQTITRLQNLLGTNHQQKLDKVFSFLNNENQNPFQDKLMIKIAGKIYFIAINQIEYIQSAGNYVEITAEGKKHLLRETMSTMMASLPAQPFLRIHRRTIINLQYLLEIRPTTYGDYDVKMKNGVTFRVSKSYKTAFLEILGLGM